MSEKTKEMDPETHFKDTFRVFSKDEEGVFHALPSEEFMHPFHGNNMYTVNYFFTFFLLFIGHDHSLEGRSVHVFSCRL